MSDIQETIVRDERAVDWVRGAWQILLFLLVIMAGMYIGAVVLVGTSQEAFDPREALRTATMLCGGGFVLVGGLIALVGGVVLTIRHTSKASVAGMQQLIESNSTATQKAIDALTKQVEKSNAYTEGAMSTMASVFAQVMEGQREAMRAWPVAAPAAPQFQAPPPSADTLAVTYAKGNTVQMRAGPTSRVVNGLTVHDSDLGDEVPFEVFDERGARHVVRYSPKLVANFIRTEWPEPRQARWKGFADVHYGRTAVLLESFGFLVGTAGGWAWCRPQEEVVQWWNSIAPGHAVPMPS